MNLVAITGGAGALGSTLAAHLHAKGYRVALLDGENAKTRLEEVGKPLGARTFAGDLAKKETWANALQSFGEAPTHAALIAGTILPRLASQWEAQKFLFVTNLPLPDYYSGSPPPIPGLTVDFGAAVLAAWAAAAVLAAFAVFVCRDVLA